MSDRRSKPIGLEEWIISAAATAAESHAALRFDDIPPSFAAADVGTPGSSIDQENNLAANLDRHGFRELARLLASPRFGRLRTRLELRLMAGRSREIGGRLDVGIVGFPPSFTYERRYGSVENVSSALRVTVESRTPQSSDMRRGVASKTFAPDSSESERR